MFNNWPFGRITIIVLFVVALCGVASAQSNVHVPKDLTQYSHEVWQTEDGLPQNSISSITQTRDGYIWFGTLEGLVRFDGVRFTVFDAGNTTALQSNRIVSLYEDRSGNLWIGTEGGGVTRMSHGKFTTFTTSEGMLSNSVGQICEDLQGRILFAQSKGVSIYQGGIINSLSHGMWGNLQGPICADQQGNIWFGSDTGLIRYYAGEFRLYTMKDGLPNYEFFSLCPGSNGALWIGTSRGLIRFQNEQFTHWTTKDGLSNDFVWSVFEKRDGCLLIGTQGGGVSYFDGKKFSKFSSNDGLSNNIVWSVFEDREGLLWIGTNGGGLNRLKSARFTTYTSLHGLAYDFVWSICEDKDGGLWFGTYNGLTKYHEGKFQSYSRQDGLSSNFIWSVYVDRKNRVWVGASNGLNKFVNGKFSSVSLPKNWPGSAIRSIYETRDGTLWVGTTRGLCGLNPSNQSSFTSVRTKDGLSNGIIMALCESKDGSLWIGTAGGLNRYRDGTVTSYTSMDGLSNDIIRSLYEDEEGNLWIGTQGGGLNLYRDRKFTAFTQRHGLFNNIVSQILEDDKGNLWMSCNKGIFRVKKQELLEFAAEKINSITSSAYGKDDGMKSPECNGSSQPAGWKARDGRLWFPTIKGVVVVDPRQDETHIIPPPVIIEKILVNKVLLNELDQANIPVESGDLEVEYTGLSFYAPEKVRFKYKLVGYDTEWKDVGTRRTAYYTNLAPGTYTFWVTAAGKDSSTEGLSASLSFNLLPNFYQETWFHVLCVGLLFSFGYVFYRIRMRQVRRREQRLIKLVNERTKNLQTEKENAERARADAERLQRLAEEANKVKSEILHIAAHDMKSPLISIKMFSQVISSESESDSPVMQFADDIYHNSQRMLDLINELLDASAIESGKISLQKTRVNVSRLAESVAFNYKKSAERKDQVLTVEVENDCYIEADESRIRQVMDNLVSNAVKYSPTGKKILVKVHACDRHVRMEIQDEGPGMTEQDKVKVFGKFQRLTSRPTGGEPSTGLGLSIVKHLVEIQQGTVWVESELGKGCNFIVQFNRVKMSGIHPNSN